MDHLPTLVTEARRAIQSADTIPALDELRVRYLGKKGEITALLKGLGKLPAAERPAAGERINEAKQALFEKLEGKLEEHRGNLRRSAVELAKEWRTDRALRLVLVSYPVLSARSVEGARVELAVRELATPRQILEFHRKIYAGRGVIDGARALTVAREMGLDQKKIIELANARRITDTMQEHALLGGALKLAATPAYVIQGVAILGHPGLEPLRKIVRSVRTCQAVVC